ncbi:MAG: hypothetical protein COV44_09455 [Deltaproteobacteria bacterium CG11_big_fil_rev_8_21_14_0_20_45_16]|nr:MAG: hypothetical protein COV44_09455 [Deltaproteobacteria bacterium CG11_big_fil_rev_8_21_14_0_20_45_16]
MKNCEFCGEGSLKKKKVKNYKYNTSLGVITVEGEVSILECSSCKESFIPGELIARWNRSILKHLKEKATHLSPSELKFIFSVLPYSQSNIAEATGKDRSTLTKYKNGENPTDPLFDHTLREIIEDYIHDRTDTLEALTARHQPSGKERPIKKIKAA